MNPGEEWPWAVDPQSVMDEVHEAIGEYKAKQVRLRIWDKTCVQSGSGPPLRLSHPIGVG